MLWLPTKPKQVLKDVTLPDTVFFHVLRCCETTGPQTATIFEHRIAAAITQLYVDRAVPAAVVVWSNMFVDSPGLIGMPNPLHSDGLVDYEEPRCTRFFFMFFQIILILFRSIFAAGWNSVYQVSNGQGCALLKCPFHAPTGTWESIITRHLFV